VITGAYLAAVFLCGDAVRAGDRRLVATFRVRALGAGVVAGGVAIGGFFVLHGDAHPLYRGLVSARALPAVIVSVLAGTSTLALVWGRRFEPARYSAAFAVAAVVAGWALAQSPRFLPGLTVRQAAAPHDTLVAVLVAILAGGALLFPALGTLFRLTLGGRLGEAAPHEPATTHKRPPAAPPPPATPPRPQHRSLLVRGAGALLVAGFGFTNVADAEWAHLVGAACYLAFLTTAFRAAVLLPAGD
jgi:cytochrome d ubiquinol oxidase subunit II